jgi:hypothetical protein
VIEVSFGFHVHGERPFSSLRSVTGRNDERVEDHLFANNA